MQRAAGDTALRILTAAALLLKDSPLSFQDRAVAIADEFGAHGFGIFHVGVGAYLHAKQFVGGYCSDEGRVLFFLEGVD